MSQKRAEDKLRGDSLFRRIRPSMRQAGTASPERPDGVAVTGKLAFVNNMVLVPRIRSGYD